MRHRAKVLVLSQCLPYPPHSGVTNRTFHILKELQKGFDVSLLSFSRRNHQADTEAIAAARTALSDHLARVYPSEPIPAEWSRIRRALDHVRSLLRGRPYTYYEYSAPGFENVVRTAIRDVQPALVHMDSLDLYRWLGLVDGCPVTCTHHSIESELLRLRGDQIRPRLLRPYLYHQARLIERVERDVSPRFRLNLMMSDLDGERLRSLAPTANVQTVPNGVDSTYFSPREAPPVRGRVVFVGPTYMFPNKDGVTFFLESIWPRIKLSEPSATLHLIGKTRPQDRLRFEESPGVSCIGYVPDIRPYLADASCCVVPLRVGGGTRLKVLDAWAMGKAVVSTSIGCEGLEIEEGQNILIRDDAQAFSEAVVSVLRSADIRERLGREGRATAVRLYSWEAVGNGLRKTYQLLVDG